jgi:ABC-2 type transport system ATP-binding protein
VLELDDLRRRYGDTVALDGLSFTVGPGQLFGFVGPNGAGKTTAMRIVLGVLQPDGGEVRWRGRPVDTAARARFGYMPEERGLYPKMRVADQLVHLARLHGLAAGHARAATELWLERLGLTGVAGRRTETLSLGNQQRAQLGAALVHEPELLVLDEPFSGLDPVGVDVLSEVLRERAREGVPVVFSSHQLELVERLCDAVAIVRSGRVVASGTVAELRARRAGRRWRVDVDGAPAGWLGAVPGATAVGRDDGTVVVELAGDADEQALLDAARRAGRVRRFAPQEPTLADLFREVVA